MGIDVHRLSQTDAGTRCTLKGAMTTARNIGFTPGTVIDVGAAKGKWSIAVSDIWGESQFVLVDPLQENIRHLQQTCALLKHADSKTAAVMDYNGSCYINVHPDLDGSSVFLEREKNVNGIPRQTPCCTIDRLNEEFDFRQPILLKADVQGAELLVLKGAEKSFPLVEMIVLEVVMFDYFHGNNPQFYDTVSFLKSKGFVVWDIWGYGYRLLDNALSQVDVAFVKDAGMFRKMHQYATETQREEQMEDLRKHNSERLRG